VILSVYGAERELRRVLEGYLRQTESDFSLALADDGSGAGVERLVREFSDRGLSIRHLWHEDRGFRKARILNRAIGSSEADYVILSDGDCIPCRRFVRDHIEWAEPGRFICGRRVLLGEELTGEILVEPGGDLAPKGFVLLAEPQIHENPAPRTAGPYHSRFPVNTGAMPLPGRSATERVATWMRFAYLSASMWSCALPAAAWLSTSVTR